MLGGKRYEAHDTSVIGDVEETMSGNAVIRVGRVLKGGDGGWIQTEYVVLSPPDARELRDVLSNVAKVRELDEAFVAGRRVERDYVTESIERHEYAGTIGDVFRVPLPSFKDAEQEFDFSKVLSEETMLALYRSVASDVVSWIEHGQHARPEGVTPLAD